MASIRDSITLVGYSIVYIFGMGYMLEMTNDMQGMLAIFWTAIWLAIIIRVNWFRKVERWSQIVGSPEMQEHLKQWHK